ncbi:MAG TPA: hypothetical protein VGS10_24075 [Terracidiphilus sp.]|nr:hypothetical protein [Terracidiphilus sp.]
MNKLQLCSLYAFLSLTIFSLAACSGSSKWGSIPGKTTLAEVTANNTSACSSSGQLPAWCQNYFSGQVDSRNGIATPQYDAAAGNVSDEDIHEYLGQSGSKTRVFANFMLGFCSDSSSPYCDDNVQTGYTSDDASTIAAQAADLQRRHIDGAIMSWEGPGSTEDDATMLFQAWADHNACSGGKCSLTYTIMDDQPSLGYDVKSTGIPGTTGQGCSRQGGAAYENCVVQHLRNDICYMNGKDWGNPAYEKINGRPVLQIFPDEQIIRVTGPAPSWADVWAQIGSWVQDLPHNCAFAPYNADNGVPLILFENVEGFTQQASSGSYFWVTPGGTNLDTDQFNYDIAGNSGDTLEDFLASAHAANNMVAYSGAYKGFNSIQSTWGTGRIMDQQCGQTWITSLLAGAINGSGGLPYMQIATWNDYNEGTEIESGIDNCYTVSAQTSGSTLFWWLNASSSAANLETVSHMEIYDSTDGQDLTLLGSAQPSMNGSWGLSKLAPGKHTLYVRMVGKNSILNRITPAVTYSTGAAANS